MKIIANKNWKYIFNKQKYQYSPVYRVIIKQAGKCVDGEFKQCLNKFPIIILEWVLGNNKIEFVSWFFLNNSSMNFVVD